MAAVEEADELRTLAKHLADGEFEIHEEVYRLSEANALNLTV